MIRLALLAAAIFAFLAPVAQATLITFEDPPDVGDDTQFVPAGYGGFDWDNFVGIIGDNLPNWNGTGYPLSDVSPFHSIYNGDGLPAAFQLADMDDTFTLNDFWLTSIYNHQLRVTITGWLDGNLLFTNIADYNVSGGAVLVPLDWVGIDRVEFSTAALGDDIEESDPITPTDPDTLFRAHLALDNIRFNEDLTPPDEDEDEEPNPIPEPATFSLTCLAALGFVYRQRRRRMTLV